MKRLLIVDDNKQITTVLKKYAEKEGYETITAFDGKDCLLKFENQTPDIILLDVMMPLLNGFEVCREIRKTSNVPIIMITARGEDFDKIMGLDIGADDYIVKPVSPNEIMARIRAIMRRIEREEKSSSKQILNFYNLTVNLDEFTVLIDKNPILLTKKETEIIWTLACKPNKVYSRDNLLNLLWGYDYYGDNRTVDSHIKRLRAKLDKYPHSKWEIKTIWGIGYKIEEITHE